MEEMANVQALGMDERKIGTREDLKYHPAATLLTILTVILLGCSAKLWLRTRASPSIQVSAARITASVRLLRGAGWRQDERLIFGQASRDKGIEVARRADDAAFWSGSTEGESRM